MSSNNNAQPSTLQSYVDAATGAVQSAVGSVLGNSGEHTQGEANKQKAQAEYDASHATVKLPGVSASSSGAVTADDPDRAAGSWNQTVGSAKEFTGGLVGSEVREPPHLIRPDLPPHLDLTGKANITNSPSSRPAETRTPRAASRRPAAR